MATVQFKSVDKIYSGNTHIVKDFCLDIDEGEFVVFLGPSGCGKSTTLRMLSGLESITDGELLINGECVNDLSPKERNIAMVFQSYALYPHMTVGENIGFSLKMEGKKKLEIEREVRRVADMLQLTPLLNRKPKALSGGQRQRVAMGRAMVRTPDVFLFDEPLSNLDAKLRNVMRTEIKELHKKHKTTTVYVTHDQVEAMTLADKVVVLRDGVIEQVGTPKEVYHHPANQFVASFIGSPTMNMLKVHMDCVDNQWFIKVNHQNIELEHTYSNDLVGKEITLGIRPSDIYLNSIQNGIGISVLLNNTELLGSNTLIHAYLGEQLLTAEVNTGATMTVNNNYQLFIDLNRIHLFDKNGDKILPVK
ncbi:sugar ABC transporter ATPase [Photobacterium gaetbulicola]|uniref:Sugar ABC transporter ATPase n=1 Tax=Photobacterium gaetbulicola TaxID=1295392 RepID=A0A0B9GAG9_9GAMM|nr:sn-glycerol-3-phosphate ABC transporter ATP-binding protein UgpC [Photobacterium gaetbulicola]KHT65589.1 sugar ABC transporter ATPase [Photobacterium gaetbulicola]